MNEPRLRAEMIDYSHRLHARGWVANHDGNITVRLGEGRFLATPTATSKAEVTLDSLLVVNHEGARVAGSSRPFSEIGLHLAVYRGRPDVHAVIHTHSPMATGFAVAGASLAEPMIAEAVVSLGLGVPTVPFAAPGAAAVAALAPFVARHDAVLLAQHGVLAWGASIEQAYLRLELVEHLASIAMIARQLGGPLPLPAGLLPGLIESRRKAGLGAAAENDKPPASKLALAMPTTSAAPAPTRPQPLLADIIRDEIAQVLKTYAK